MTYTFSKSWTLALAGADILSAVHGVTGDGCRPAIAREAFQGFEKLGVMGFSGC